MADTAYHLGIRLTSATDGVAVTLRGLLTTFDVTTDPAGATIATAQVCLSSPQPAPPTQLPGPPCSCFHLRSTRAFRAQGLTRLPAHTTCPNPTDLPQLDGSL
jgi:hypothetical protein